MLGTKEKMKKIPPPTPPKLGVLRGTYLFIYLFIYSKT
jgi:hypothetical protein